MRPPRERGKQPPRRFGVQDHRDLAAYRRERAILALMRHDRIPSWQVVPATAANR